MEEFQSLFKDYNFSDEGNWGIFHTTQALFQSLFKDYNLSDPNPWE